VHFINHQQPDALSNRQQDALDEVAVGKSLWGNQQGLCFVGSHPRAAVPAIQPGRWN
jgi:hypothetical protein